MPTEMQFYLALPLLGWLMHRLGRSGKTLNQSRGRISYGIYLWHFAIANFWFLNGNLVGSEPLPILAFRGRTGFLGGTGSGGGDPRAAPPVRSRAVFTAQRKKEQAGHPAIMGGHRIDLS